MMFYILVEENSKISKIPDTIRQEHLAEKSEFQQFMSLCFLLIKQACQVSNYML